MSVFYEQINDDDDDDLAILVKNAQVAARKLAIQLNPINRDLTRSHCDSIAKLNAAPHSSCRPVHPARRRS